MGIKNECTRSLIMVSLFVNFLSNFSKGLSNLDLLKFDMIVAYLLEAFSTVLSIIQSKYVSTVPLWVYMISLYNTSSLFLKVSSACLLPK